jgi:gamma-tubulin complex component 3
MFLDLRGIPILSQLYSYVNYCGAGNILNKVLEVTSKPLFIFIKNWMIYGELLDPFKEFFVDINESVVDDEIWSSRYLLITKNIPNFFNKNFAQKIFEIGKCVNFIRNYCAEPSYTLTRLKSKLNEERKNKMEVDEKDSLNEKKVESIKLILNIEDDSYLNLNLLPDLFSEIDYIYNEINKELVEIIFKKFKLFENLNSINRYLLLGQGDMMQYLMDLLFTELNKNSSQIYKHNLLNILETAIRASNAQFHDHDCLKRLNIKLMDSSSGDTGWDIFVLEYNVETPLNVIFSKKLLKEYQKLFFFFWKLKRLEFSQDHQIWRNFMTYAHTLKGRFDYLRPYIQKSMLFNQQIIHFVTNLHNYIALEVLETEYKKLIEKFSSITKLDELIDLHKKFVASVIEQSLLNSEYNSMYKKIILIFDLIIRFKTAQDVLITTLFEEYYRNMDNFSPNREENK